MKTQNLLSLLAVSVALVLAGCDDSTQDKTVRQTGPDPELPPAESFLIPPMKVPSGTQWKEGETPKVAEGLKIEKVAGDFKHPRQLYTLPNGDVLVVEAAGPKTPVSMPKQLVTGLVKSASGKGGEGGNRITLLRNTSGDGKTWERHIFLENLSSPFGVQLVGNTLYVANADSLVTYPYTPGATRISDPGTVLTELPAGINHHWTKALLASPDGSKLYVGVGSNSNITENGIGIEYRRAAILEVDAASGASRIYASGLRNPTGMQWEPQTGRLWAIVNERDEIGANLVPDYMTAVEENGFYGWPYSYFGKHLDPRVQPQRPDLVEKSIKPDYALGSHVAPLGLWFYTGTNLPEKYRGGAFISEHGSWNRNPLNGYRVSWVAFENGRPVGEPEPVVTGFLTDDHEQVRGLPVGLTMDNQGGLMIADDAANVVWRVTNASAP